MASLPATHVSHVPHVSLPSHDFLLLRADESRLSFLKRRSLREKLRDTRSSWSLRRSSEKVTIANPYLFSNNLYLTLQYLLLSCVGAISRSRL